jgi:hypothetical protein
MRVMAANRGHTDRVAGRVVPFHRTSGHEWQRPLRVPPGSVFRGVCLLAPFVDRHRVVQRFSIGMPELFRWAATTMEMPIKAITDWRCFAISNSESVVGLVKEFGSNLIPYDTTMGRCLTYQVFGNPKEGPIPHMVRRRIQLAADMLTYHFTWTSESLYIHFGEYPAITYAAEPPNPWQAMLGEGGTKVGDDEWNALLITRYMRWVSTQIPTRTVRLSDEGDYIVASYAIFRDGDISLDSGCIKRQCQYLQDSGQSELVPKVEEAVLKACRGEFFRTVPAADYVDCKEIADLGLTPDDLAKLTLEDVADRMTFPWQTDWLISQNKF